MRVANDVDDGLGAALNENSELPFARLKLNRVLVLALALGAGAAITRLLPHYCECVYRARYYELCT